jgi:internalin A
MTLENKVRERIERATKHGWNRLDLTNCGLTKIPDVIFEKCLDVTIVDLSNTQYCDETERNKIKTIPESISRLKNLIKLNLAYNELSDINDALGKLENLKYLDLSNNHIKYLPPQVANLPKLEQIFLEGNPFDLLPPEIVARGKDSIRNFIKELEVQDFLYEAKLIIVGEGRVGKTCISKALTQTNYELEEQVSTEGININTWIVDHEEIKKINQSIQRDLQINVWDFGGQEIYHSTHQFFLTKRAIYMIVTESRKEDRHEDFYYWLNIIKILGDQSPVIMVLNKCDQPNREIPFKEFQETFTNLKNFFKISLKKEFQQSFAEFKKELITITSNLPHIGSPLPKVWVDIRIELEKLKTSGENYISESKYFDICKKYYRDIEGALFLSDYFHDLGVILHFKDDIELRDTVFLNHEWITKGVYKILDDKKVIDQKGRFNSSDIQRIWNEEYREKMGQLLSLMRNKKFDLCFELQNGDYLAPRLLPVDEPELNWINESGATRFEIRYKFMPKGILSRLIVKMHQDISDNKYWRYGVWLRFENTDALVREKYFENKISIIFQGQNKKEFLAIIRKHILEINKDFKRLKFEEMVQCVCNECKNSDRPHFYPYDLLKRYESKKIPFIRCNNSLSEIPIAELLSDVLSSVISKEKLIFCENKNSELLNNLDLINVSFVPEKDATGVFTQTRSRPEKYGLRDRDFLLDSEIEKLKSKYPNYYILDYYCIENYLYHPSNITELRINNLDIQEYKQELITQKNRQKHQIISIFKQSRKNYYELRIDSEKIQDKNNENEIIEYLNSEDIEVFFKAYSIKEYFKKDIISKFGISQIELARTNWFKNKIIKLIDPSPSKEAEANV